MNIFYILLALNIYYLKDLLADMKQNPHISEVALWMTNINELFCATYIMSEIFDLDKLNKECPCSTISEQREKEYRTVFNFLYYYLCYRVNSPKSLELFIMGLLLHPNWKVKEELDPQASPSFTDAYDSEITPVSV